ncbi:MAG: T9SS type A sorting domain-containing protein, partial [Bacteroidia bacterium]|nr:T9SS type A sorting domain-containing protein [Bacteroidia bacterium]
MLKKLIISLSLYTCACSLRAQVWTKVLDSVPGFFQVTTLVKDTVSNVLYFGGRINTANDKICKGVAKYNGSNFDSLQSGVDGYGGVVKSLQMFQNKLYVMGSFLTTGKYNCKFIGRWNGASWDSVNFNPNQPIWWSDVYNNELYVAGWFDTIAGQAIKHVAKFDGTNWHDLSFPYADRVEAIKNYKGTLYAASYTGVWQYKNNTWTHLADCGGDMFREVYGMEVIDSLLYMYGRFTSLGGVTSKGIVAFDGVKWYGLGQGVSYTGYEEINNVQKIDGKIYITGNFENIEGIGCSTANQNTNYAVLDNNQWCIKSPPFDNTTFGVVKYNNELYIYGAFWKCGNDSVVGFGKWNGGNSSVACSNTFSITNTYVGINEISITDNISIYPNPTSSIINIVDENNQLQNATIQIKNYLGQLVYASAFTSQINLSNLS